MKKYLGISLIAILAVSPLTARATEALANNPVSGVEVGTDTNIAGTTYVKTAYNAMVAEVNTVANSLQGQINTLNGGAEDEGSVQATVKANATNATFRAGEGDHYYTEDITPASTIADAINDVDARVHDLSTSLGGAAFVGVDDIVNNVKTGLAVPDDMENDGYDINAKSLRVNYKDVLTTDNVNDFATAEQGTKADNAAAAITTLNGTDATTGSVAHTVKTTAKDATYEGETTIAQKIAELDGREDEDTTYTAGDGLQLEETEFKVYANSDQFEFDDDNKMFIKDGAITADKLNDALLQDSVRASVTGEGDDAVAYDNNKTIASEKAVHTAINDAVSGLGDTYATKDGVVSTIGASSVKVPVYTTWGLEDDDHKAQVDVGVTAPTVYQN